jgi:hypothetical protein
MMIRFLLQMKLDFFKRKFEKENSKLQNIESLGRRFGFLPYSDLKYKELQKRVKIFHTKYQQLEKELKGES